MRMRMAALGSDRPSQTASQTHNSVLFSFWEYKRSTTDILYMYFIYVAVYGRVEKRRSALSQAVLLLQEC